MVLNHNYSPACGLCLGAFHITFGLGCCGCGIAAIALNSYLADVAVGIWAGVAFYGTTGILGLASSGRNYSVITAYYVVSLLSVFVAMSQTGMYIWVLIHDIRDCRNTLYWRLHAGCPQEAVKVMLVQAVLLLLGFLEWILSAASCCTACSCCSNKASSPTQIHTLRQSAVAPQQSLDDPAVTMPPLDPSNDGYSGGNMPQNVVTSQPKSDHDGTPSVISDSVPRDDAQIYNNVTFDPTAPIEDTTNLPHIPQRPQENVHRVAEY